MSIKKTALSLTASALALVAFTTISHARDQISIVGSSTVFPFATTVAERFGKNTSFKTPVIESTGSGGGLKLFCAGAGEDTPDITNASRRIKASEVALCASNGVTDIVEVKIGFDGIVLANSRKSGLMDITRKDIFLALAKNVPDGEGNIVPNPNTTWADVNPVLPAVKIEVLGPPPTSGTRDAFVELAMLEGCDEIDSAKALADTDKDAHAALCETIREDGAYVEAGENDNLIVQKLEANPDAFGIFGYSFLDQNSDQLQGNLIGGVEPNFENIADGEYPVSRSLFFYVKKAHVGVIPGIEEYLAEFISEDAMGEYGYLAEKGLIPLPESEAAKTMETVKNLSNLSL